MDRQTVLEYLRIILIAFVIAFVINIVRVAVFTQWNNEPRFENVTQPEPAPQERTNRTENNVSQDTGINPDLRDSTTIISISPMENFSGLSKDRILEKRIDAMNTSPLFSHMRNYSPSQSVFRIDDGLPWISADAALHWSKVSTEEKYNGVSRDSIGILNPELLYYISLQENEDSATENYKPLYKDSYFVPRTVNYNRDTNTITAYFRNARTENGNYQPISLADTNAHDLGYQYAYMDQLNNVGFYTDEPYRNNRLDKDIKEVTGWYMHGPACGVPGGCNNYAPYWQYYNYFYLRSLPASFNIKLWKQRPASVQQRADINFKMVFE